MTRYEKGFMNKCAEYGVDGRAFLEKQAIDFDLARRAASKFSSGKWSPDMARKLMARILKNPPKGDIGHFGMLSPSVQDRILRQVGELGRDSGKPAIGSGLAKYLRGLKTTDSANTVLSSAGKQRNEFLTLLSDVAERPKLLSGDVASAESLGQAMNNVKSKIPARWKDMDGAAERLFDALSRG